MKRLELKPRSFPCSLKDCPPGFFVYQDNVGFKSQYLNSDNAVEAYLSDGTFFWGDALDIEDRENNLIVLPVEYVWVSGE